MAPSVAGCQWNILSMCSRLEKDCVPVSSSPPYNRCLRLDAAWSLTRGKHCEASRQLVKDDGRIAAVDIQTSNKQFRVTRGAEIADKFASRVLLC